MASNPSTIILIGAICAGKSTIAQRLSEKLNIRRYEVDEHRWDFYQEIGYDAKEASKIVAERGMIGLIQYWKPFEAHAVERILATQSNCVIDFGAGHSVYDDGALFRRVENALQPFPHVFLITPSPDRERSVTILNERFADLLRREGQPVAPELMQLNAHFIQHPANEQLAKHIFYTDGKTPDQTTAEIIGQLS